MELRFALLSPYARKVRVVVHEVGLADRIKMTVVNVRDKPEDIVPWNPLGKIPALSLDDGGVLYDSPVICEYLDAEFGGRRLLPASGDAALANPDARRARRRRARRGDPRAQRAAAPC